MPGNGEPQGLHPPLRREAEPGDYKSIVVFVGPSVNFARLYTKSGGWLGEWRA